MFPDDDTGIGIYTTFQYEGNCRLRIRLSCLNDINGDYLIKTEYMFCVS